MKKLFTIVALMFVSSITMAQNTSKYGDMKFPAEENECPRITEKTKVVYVDKDPNSYSSMLIMSCSNFSGGVAWYQDPATKKWGLIDTLGNVVKAPYKSLGFGEKLPKYFGEHAFAKAPQGERGYQIIDKQGNVVKKLSAISEIGEYNLVDGYVGVLYYGDFYSGSKYGYINFDGNAVYPATSATGKYTDCPTAYRFSDGLAPFENQITHKWGYFNKAGKIVIEAKYSKAKIFSDGVAAVCLDNKWGYIDTTGKVVIDFKFSVEPENFVNNRAIVYRATGNAKCVIDKNCVILKEFYNITPFNHNGLAIAKVKKEGYRWEQNILMNTDFEEVVNFGEMPMFATFGKTTFTDYGDFYVVEPEGYTSSYVTDCDLNVRFKVYDIYTFCENRAFVLYDSPDGGRLSAFVNPQGEVVILFKYNEF